MVGAKQDLQEREGNVAMDASLDLHIDVQVKVQPKLKGIGLLSSATLLASYLPEGVTE
jgi:hypothetical protein